MGRIKAAAACASLVVALGACSSGGGGDKPQAKPTKDAAGALQVWVRGSGDSQKAYQAIFDAFTKKTGVKVNMFMTLTDFETKFNAAAAAKNLPDLVINDAAQLGSLETQGVLRKVDRNAIKGQNQISDKTWNQAKDLNGLYFAVPFSVQANVLYVRSDWLQQAGLQAPKTWDDYVKVAKAFTKGNQYGVGIPGSTQRGYAAWYWSNYLFAAGGDFVKPAGKGKYKPTVNSPAAVKAADFLKSLVCTDKVAQPGVANAVTTDANKAFYTGVTGTYLTGPYSFAAFDAYPVKGHYQVVAPPKGPKSDAVLAEGTNLYFMTGAKHPNAADKLAEYMITPAAQKLGMTAVPGATVVRLPVNTTLKASSVHPGDPRWTLAEQVYTKSGKYEPDYLPDWTNLRQIAAQDINALLATCGDPRSTLDKMQSEFTDDMRKQGVLG
jgi:multiple sugar transport system substrate-binding protein